MVRQAAVPRVPSSRRGHAAETTEDVIISSAAWPRRLNGIGFSATGNQQSQARRGRPGPGYSTGIRSACMIPRMYPMARIFPSTA